MDLGSWNWKCFWTFLCEISLLSYHFLPSRKLVCHLQGTRSDFVSIRKVKSNYYESKNYVFKTFSVRVKILDSTDSNDSVRDRDAVDSSASKQIFIRNIIPMIIKRFIKWFEIQPLTDAETLAHVMEQAIKFLMGLVTSILPNGQIDIIAEDHVVWYFDGTELEMFHIAMDLSGSSLSLTWSYNRSSITEATRTDRHTSIFRRHWWKFDVLDDVLHYDETLPGRAALNA